MYLQLLTNITGDTEKKKTGLIRTMPEIVSLGGMLVEIMRKGLDEPLHQPADFIGPFPSGDTPIFIDTAARLGHSSGFIGVVGEDDFGKCILDRLEADGVDTSHVRREKNATTGVAFVAYFQGGKRKFIYHWSNSAAGLLGPEDVTADYLRDIKWLHVTGVTLAVNESGRKAVYKALKLISDNVKVSFDPNIRPEVLSAAEIRKLCEDVIARADLIIPSLSEAAMLTGLDTDDAGCRAFQKAGKTAVLKLGDKGCRIYSREGITDVPAFQVKEIDPTGAGDSFCAGFITALLEGKSPYEAGLFANAVGALAVTKKGPMEGAPFRYQVDQFMRDSGK